MMVQPTWERFKRSCCAVDSIRLRVDISRMDFGDEFFSSMQPRMQRAFAEMEALESGAPANRDEGRMVGHYWLRSPELAPTDEITQAIRDTLGEIKSFAAGVHEGTVTGAAGERFTHMLAIGIGGSALGPQFVSDALAGSHTEILAYFIDNTDPDGMDRVFTQIGPNLARTLVLVITKSGGTIETRNGVLEVRRWFKRAGLIFERHAVAITGEGSTLDLQAGTEQWLRRFPIWEWVGGRTSVLSPVGLVPAALQGHDIDALLAGASACDAATRVAEIEANPAALLALMWYYAGEGKGAKNMVVLPYKDRLALFSKYLQQLVMESLGKELDRDGRVVHQGLTVLGNKGSTDQHAYLQQLRDGPNDFFVTFIEVLRDCDGESIHVEPDVTSGDYLNGFLQGTRRALYEKRRQSITLTIDEVSARSIGALIALFERAVGLYASLVNINAYHQPGVEAGKKAAGAVIAIQQKLIRAMRADRRARRKVEEWASQVGAEDDLETVFHILEHLVANEDRGVLRLGGTGPFDRCYGVV